MVSEGDNVLATLDHQQCVFFFFFKSTFQIILFCCCSCWIVVFLTFLHLHHIENLRIRFKICFCRGLQIKPSNIECNRFSTLFGQLPTPSWSTGVWSQKKQICHFKVQAINKKFQKYCLPFCLRIPKASSRKQLSPEAFR